MSISSRRIYFTKGGTVMTKGLEALHHPRVELASIDISAEGKQDIGYMPFYKTTYRILFFHNPAWRRTR